MGHIESINFIRTLVKGDRQNIYTTYTRTAGIVTRVNKKTIQVNQHNFDLESGQCVDKGFNHLSILSSTYKYKY